MILTAIVFAPAVIIHNSVYQRYIHTIGQSVPYATQQWRVTQLHTVRTDSFAFQLAWQKYKTDNSSLRQVKFAKHLGKMTHLPTQFNHFIATTVPYMCLDRAQFALKQSHWQFLQIQFSLICMNVDRLDLCITKAAREYFLIQMNFHRNYYSAPLPKRKVLLTVRPWYYKLNRKMPQNHINAQILSRYKPYCIDLHYNHGSTAYLDWNIRHISITHSQQHFNTITILASIHNSSHYTSDT